MRNTLIIIPFLTLISCKKDFTTWQTPIPIGTKFTYDYKLYGDVPWGKAIPVQPFTVDSVAVGAYHGYNGYWVSNAQGMSFVVDPTVIKHGR